MDETCPVPVDLWTVQRELQISGVASFLLSEQGYMPKKSPIHCITQAIPLIELLKLSVTLCPRFLGAYTCAPSVPGTADVQICLKMLRHAIEKSDAMLYATSTNDVEEKCKIMSLKCYMLELIMVIDEEEIMDNNHADCIADFDSTLPETNSIGCPPCESYSLKNITEFLESLNTLLEEMTVRWKLKIT